MFKSSFGNINLSEKVTLPDNSKPNKLGYMCFNLDKFIISYKLSQQGKAEICTYEGYFFYAEVRYPYDNKSFIQFVKFINKNLEANEKPRKGFDMWLGTDYADGLSSTFLSNNKKDGLVLTFGYDPTNSLTPYSKSEGK